MRITIVQGPFLPVPPLRGGAVEKIMSGLGPAWAARGHTVVHVSRRFPGLPDQEDCEGVRHLRIASLDAPSSSLRFRLAELLYCLRARAALPPADILLTNSPLLPMLPLPDRLGRVCPRVGRYPKGQHRFYRRIGRLIGASRPISRALAEQVPRLADRVVTLSGPIGRGLTPPPPAQAAGTRNRTVLYVGRLHPEKGLGLLIDAFGRADLPDWRLRLVGPWEVAAGGGGAGYLAELQARGAGLGERLAIPGPSFDEAALRSEYRQAELFCYPSLAERGEALPLAPLEAMAMGAVPLVSGLDCFGDYVEPGRTGFVFDHRAADPVAALSHMLERAAAADADAMRPAILDTARRFTVDAVAARYLEVFEALLAEPGGARA